MSAVKRSTNEPRIGGSEPPGDTADSGDHHGVHEGPVLTLVERLACEVILRYATGRRVLDLGCGSEFVASAVEPRAGSFVAVPREALLSGPGALPVQDASIDVIYSLNTLPFVSDDSDRSDEIIEHALVEISRILVAGGYALVEIANPTSLWGLYNGIRHAAKALERGPLTATTDRGMTRFETAAHFAHRLPPTLEVTNLHGLRLVTVTAHILALPLVGRIVRRIEWLCRDRGFARRFSGSQMLVLRRLSAPFVP